MWSRRIAESRRSLAPVTRSPATSTTPASGPVEPAEHVQQRRLPRARAAQDRDDLAARDLELRAVEHAPRRPGPRRTSAPARVPGPPPSRLTVRTSASRHCDQAGIGRRVARQQRHDPIHPPHGERDDPRRLPDRRRGRPGRHGRGLPRHAARPRPPGGAEGDRVRAGRQRRLPQPLQVGVAARGVDRPPQRGPGLRGRRGRRRALPRHALRRGHRPALARRRRRAAGWSPSARCASSGRSAPRSTPPTAAASCTATSSRRTC